MQALQIYSIPNPSNVNKYDPESHADKKQFYYFHTISLDMKS